MQVHFFGLEDLALYFVAKQGLYRLYIRRSLRSILTVIVIFLIETPRCLTNIPSQLDVATFDQNGISLACDIDLINQWHCRLLEDLEHLNHGKRQASDLLV